MIKFSTACTLCGQTRLSKIFLPCGHSLCLTCYSIQRDTIASVCPIQGGCIYPSNSCTDSLGYLLSKVGGLSNLQILVSKSVVSTSGSSDTDADSTSRYDNTVLYHEDANDQPATATDIHHNRDALEDSSINELFDASVLDRQLDNDYPPTATDIHHNRDTLADSSINELVDNSVLHHEDANDHSPTATEIGQNYDAFVDNGSNQADNLSQENFKSLDEIQFNLAALKHGESFLPREVNLRDSISGGDHKSSQIPVAQELETFCPVAQSTSEYSPEYPVAHQSNNIGEDSTIKRVSRSLKQSSNSSKSRKKKDSTALNSALSDEPQIKKQKRQSDPDDVWMNYYSKVLHFGEQNKHLNVPKDECVEDGGAQYKIGTWLSRQRTNFMHHMTAGREQCLRNLIINYGLWMGDSKVANIIAKHPQDEDNPDANYFCSSSSAVKAEKNASTASAICSTSSMTSSNFNSNYDNHDSSSIRINATHVPLQTSRPVYPILPPDNNVHPSKIVGNRRTVPQQENKDLQQSVGTLFGTSNTMVDEKPDSSDAMLTKRVSAKATPPDVIAIVDTKPTRPQGINSQQKGLPLDFSSCAAQPKSPEIVTTSTMEKSQKEIPKVSLRNLATVKTEGTPSPFIVDSRKNDHLPDHRLLSPPMQIQPVIGARQPPLPSQPPPPPPAFPLPMSLTRQYLQLNNERFSPSPPTVSSNRGQLLYHADQQTLQPLQLPTQTSQPIRPQQPPPPPPQHSLQSRNANAQQITKPSISISEGDYIGFLYMHNQGAMLEYGMGKVYSISGNGKSLSYEVLQLKPCWDGQQPRTVETFVNLHFALVSDEILTVDVDQLHGKIVYKIPLQPDWQLSSTCKRTLQQKLSSLGLERKICFM